VRADLPLPNPYSGLPPMPMINFPLPELRHEQTIRLLSGLTAAGVLDALFAACDRDVLAEVAARVREYLDHCGSDGG
jgi:hypothetical protein